MAQDTATESKMRRKSEAARAFAEDGPRRTHVGGQALIEGVMMRGIYNWAVAVREPDGGMHVEEHDLASGRQKNGWMYWPVVRGCRAFVESLVLGYKALEIAASHAFSEEDEDEPELPAAADGAASAAVSRGKGEGEKRFSWKDDFGNPDEMIDALGAQRVLEPLSGPASMDPSHAASPCPMEPRRDDDAVSAVESASDPSGASDDGGFGKKEMVVSMALGLVLGVVLFIVAPAFITNAIVGEYDSNPVLWNITDGILRVMVFVSYIWLIGRMDEIRRMFSYHGAEHKTIHCYEHGVPLTPENARRFPRLHVRCGTAFLIMVMIIAIFVYTALPLDALIGAWGVPDGLPKLLLVIAVRIVFIPVIAGVSYEITVKWAGSHPGNPLVKIVLWPGMQMQRLTTKEPDDGMLECAIAAMQRVLDREEAEAASRG